MGYRLPDRTVLLVFEGTDYAGAEVRMRVNVPLGAFLEMQKLRASGEVEAVDRLFQFIGELLVEWNLEDELGALPANYEGLLRLSDAQFFNSMVDGWTEAMAGVPAPLEPASSSGGT